VGPSIKMEEAKFSLLRLDLIIIVVLLAIGVALFRENIVIIGLVASLVLFSRATSLYDHLKIEFHSVFILATAFLYGAGAGIFIAVATSLLVNKAGKLLGSFQKPPWILLDTIYLCTLSIIASILPARELFFYGLLTIIIVGNLIMGTIRIAFFMDPLMRRLPLSTINIMFNYLILQNFLDDIILLLS
jgi:hypothetical protein